jgi:hypothetical protein
MREGLHLPDRMDARDETPQPLQRVRVFQLRRAPAAARRQCKLETAMLVQRAAVEGQRRHHRQLARGGSVAKSNLPIASVVQRPDSKLGDDGDTIQPYLNAVFNSTPAAVAAQAATGFDGVESSFGIQWHRVSWRAL